MQQHDQILSQVSELGQISMAESILQKQKSLTPTFVKFINFLKVLYLAKDGSFFISVKYSWKSMTWTYRITKIL